jgi:DNA end-binding protein Ku
MASTVWKGHLSFGLLSVPIKLTSAARRESVSFNMLRKSDHSRVKQVLVAQADDVPVPRSEIVKGYEHEKDKYVVIEDADIETIAPKTAKVVEVMEFVKASQINAVFMDSSYYVAPGGAAGERAYSLLYKALLVSGCVGVAKIAMNGREHIVIVRPGAHGIVMHTMFYADEIRQVEEFRTECDQVKDVELQMAVQLITSMQAAFEPDKYRDGYRESVMRMIAAKVKGDPIGTAAAPAHRAEVIDIMTALKRSLNKNDATSASAGTERGSHVSGKPHTNAQGNARKRSAGVERASHAISPRVRTQRAMGDPLSTDSPAGSSPRGSSRSAVGTPKRGSSRRKTGA